MNNLLLGTVVFATVLHASEKKEDPTEKYRNKKAHEAIIHDAYYEAKKMTDIPTAWKEAVEAFGYKEDDIEFYSTVRINKFVERVGNKLMILYPNFQMYATPAEQKAYIGLQLASLQQDTEFDIGGSHETFYETKKTNFRNTTMGLTALGLVALYHKQILESAHNYGPTFKNVIFSKAAALIAACFVANKANDLIKEHDKIKKFDEAQFIVIDKLGAEGLLSMREKQVNWGKNKAWWIQRKWNYMLGKLSLTYNPEANLELINEYIAKKAAVASH